MGDVGEDRDVVGDRTDALERQAVRRALDDGRPVAGPRPSRAGPPGGAGRPVSWRGPRSVPGVRRSRIAAVPIIPLATPAASSAATARNAVVVLPSVPVMPTTASSWLGSPYHHAAALARAAGARSTMSWGSATSGSARSTTAAAAPARAAASTYSCPSTCRPGIATNSEPVVDGARVVGDAPHEDVRQSARPDRPTVAARASQAALGGQALDEPARARPARLVPRRRPAAAIVGAARRARRRAVIGGSAARRGRSRVPPRSAAAG